MAGVRRLCSPVSRRARAVAAPASLSTARTWLRAAARDERGSRAARGEGAVGQVGQRAGARAVRVGLGLGVRATRATRTTWEEQRTEAEERVWRQLDEQARAQMGQLTVDQRRSVYQKCEKQKQLRNACLGYECVYTFIYKPGSRLLPPTLGS